MSAVLGLAVLLTWRVLRTLGKRTAVMRRGAGRFADGRANLFAGLFGGCLRVVDCLAHGGPVIRGCYFVLEFRFIGFGDFLFTVLAVFLLKVRWMSAILGFANSWPGAFWAP